MNTYSDSTGMRLLHKGKKGIIHAIFSRLGLILLLFLLQLFLIFSILFRFNDFLPHLLGSNLALTFIMVIYLINSRIDPSAKITWLIIIILAPVFGAILLLVTQTEIGNRAIKARIQQLNKLSSHALEQNETIKKQLENKDKKTATLAHYLNQNGHAPVYDQTQVTYFKSGEEKFDALLNELSKAEHFIFLEYFIIDEGLMWGKILEILVQKAKAGVEVRVMFDGTCEFTTLPHNYPKWLKQLGIECKMFSPLTPFVSTHYNYRDHRKILVIDGKTGFTGGINLADEYINHINKYGHWKDTAIMLKGEAVKTLTLLFLELWNIDTKQFDYHKYLNFPIDSYPESKGYVIPYGDCPLDDDKVGEKVYMDILNRSTNYVHIMSPYLILDGVMETALKFAAERGVDVKLILPGIPDKKFPYALAKSHYASLMESGVQIYEYTPGFVHAKVFVSDDTRAVVGTINLDYRSLYHHFECACYLHETDCIPEIEQDFQDTLMKCKKVTFEDIRKEKVIIRILGVLLKAIAPLM